MLVVKPKPSAGTEIFLTLSPVQPGVRAQTKDLFEGFAECGRTGESIQIGDLLDAQGALSKLLSRRADPIVTNVYISALSGVCFEQACEVFTADP